MTRQTSLFIGESAGSIFEASCSMVDGWVDWGMSEFCGRVVCSQCDASAAAVRLGTDSNNTQSASSVMLVFLPV